MTTFAERLKNAMEQANMSQSALSEQAGASKAAISQYLSGKNTPGPDRIKALADATGVSFDYLMGYGAAPVAEPPIKKISVKEAARCMGKSDQFVRIGLQRGLLPFGNAVPGTGACWNYYINPTKFRDYVGADQFNSFFLAECIRIQNALSCCDKIFFFFQIHFLFQDLCHHFSDCRCTGKSR